MGSPIRVRNSLRSIGLAQGIWRPVNGTLPVGSTSFTFVVVFHVVSVTVGVSDTWYDTFLPPSSNFYILASSGNITFAGPGYNATGPRVLGANDVGTVCRVIVSLEVGTGLTVWLNRVPGTTVAAPSYTVGVPTGQTLFQSTAFGAAPVIGLPALDIAMTEPALSAAQVAELDAAILDESGVPSRSPVGAWNMLMRAEDAVPGQQWRERTRAVNCLQVGAKSVFDEIVPGSKNAPWGKAA